VVRQLTTKEHQVRERERERESGWAGEAWSQKEVVDNAKVERDKQKNEIKKSTNTAETARTD
jgi:hypothetical protein